MNREQLRRILEEVLETGIGDYAHHRGGWFDNQEYTEAREQNLEGNVDLILHLLEKGNE